MVAVEIVIKGEAATKIDSNNEGARMEKARMVETITVEVVMVVAMVKILDLVAAVGLISVR
jgi:hypothetical protein